MFSFRVTLGFSVYFDSVTQHIPLIFFFSSPNKLILVQSLAELPTSADWRIIRPGWHYFLSATSVEPDISTTLITITQFLAKLNKPDNLIFISVPTTNNHINTQTPKLQNHSTPFFISTPWRHKLNLIDRFYPWFKVASENPELHKLIQAKPETTILTTDLYYTLVSQPSADSNHSYPTLNIIT